MPRRILEERLRGMLAEDVGQGDITTALLVQAGTNVEAEVRSNEQGVVAGIEEAEVLLESLGLRVEVLVADGESVKTKEALMRVSGDARTVLSAERTLLNVLSRMSGIATATRDLIGKLQKAGVKTRVASTRKTAPGLLYFDKKAVLLGGGDTHRLHLDDMILIKDNHIAVAGGIAEAVRKAIEQASFSKKVEVEVAKVQDVLVAAEAGADIIMVDNFSPKEIEEALALLRREKLYGKVLLEASGGITAENILSFCLTGVDIVSLGEITDSPKTLDIGLEITKIKK